MDERAIIRRQVSVFLDGRLGEQLAGLRRRWDTDMAQRIDPHVTVIYDCDDTTLTRLSDVASSTAPFALRVGSPQCWGDPTGGIYLPVFDDADALRGICDRLGETAPGGVIYRAHMTLTHSRTTPAATAIGAWRALEHLMIDGEWTVRELCVVGLVADRWRSEASVRLGVP